jgi:transcription antitermination factor NusG
MVSFGDRNPPIPDWEMAQLQQALTSGLLVEPWPFLKAGQRVRIIAGPLAGIEAVLLQLSNGWRVVVGIELLQRSISVQIDRDCIEPESAGGWKSGVPSLP